MKLRNKKTGEIVDTNDYNFKIATPAEPLYGHDAFDVREEYNSLSELNEEWEDYKPAEPLIKDRKIRKAVRAWAEVNGVDEVAYVSRLNSFGRFGNSIMFDNNLDLHDDLEDARFYTIAELCGEEEE